MGWGTRDRCVRCEFLLSHIHPVPIFAIHSFIGWQGHIPKRWPPPPFAFNVFPVSFAIHQHPRAVLPFLGLPQAKRKLKGVTGLSMLHKRLRGAYLAKISTQKTGCQHCQREPSLGTKVGGTEDRASAPLAFGQHPVLDTWELPGQRRGM